MLNEARKIELGKLFGSVSKKKGVDYFSSYILMAIFLKNSSDFVVKFLFQSGTNVDEIVKELIDSPSPVKNFSSIYYTREGSIIDGLLHFIEEAKSYYGCGDENLCIDHLISWALSNFTYKFKKIDIQLFSNYMDDVCKLLLGDKDAEKKVNEFKIDKKDSKIKALGTQNSDIFDFGIDLTEQISGASEFPAIGREREIENIIMCCNRLKKPNCILCGEAGVGKTAIVEGLAYHITNNSTKLGKIANYRIISISVGSLVAGSKYRGDLEKKVKSLLDFIKNNKNIILFIDEIHMIVGAGSTATDAASDISNLLKPVLSRGEAIFIGATTKNEYQKYIAPDEALERRFCYIEINEPDEATLIHILNSHKRQIEQYHNIVFRKSDIISILNACKILLPKRKFPDKAVEMLDGYGSYLRVRELKSTKRNLINFLHHTYNEDNKSGGVLGFIPQLPNSDLIDIIK